MLQWSLPPPDFSDHCAGVLKFVQAPCKKTSFKFFNFLIRPKDFFEVVKQQWSSTSVYGTQMYQLCAKLRALKARLRSLNYNHYGGYTLKSFCGQGPFAESSAVCSYKSH